MEKFLIINADDFGMSKEANQAICELLNEGKISSASLMPNGLEYDNAVDMIRENEFKSIGIHLTLTRDGFDAKSPLIYGKLSSARSIVDENGQIYTGVSELKQHAAFCDLIRECAAQFNRIKSSAIHFTHIDNHMYSLFPGCGIKGYLAMFLAYFKVFRRNKKKGVRFARKYKELPEVFPVWSGRRRYPIVIAMMKLLNLRGVDYAYAFPYNAKNIPTKEEKIECFEKFLSNLPGGYRTTHASVC